MKKLSSLLLCLVLTLSILVGCNSTTTSTTSSKTASSTPAGTTTAGTTTVSNKPVEISYWTLTDSRTKHAEYVMAKFKEANPTVTVNIVSNSVDNHKKNLQIAASSNTLPSMWYNWGGTLGSFYPENKLSYDLTQYAKDNGWDTLYDAASLGLCKLGGQLSGAPISTNSFAITYRKDLFTKAGITAEPTTFAQFEEILAKLKAAKITPLALAGKNGWQVFRLIELLMEKNLGAEKHDQLLAMKTEIWLDEGITKSFEEFKSFVDKGYFPEGFVTQEPADAGLLLSNGVAAITIDGVSTINRVVSSKGDVSLYGIFALPLSDKGNRMTSYVVMNQFSAKLKTNELAAAMAFHNTLFDPQAIAGGENLLQYPVSNKKVAVPANQPWTKILVDAVAKKGAFLITDQGLPQEVVTKLFETQDGVAMGQIKPQQVGQLIKTAADAYLKNK